MSLITREFERLRGFVDVPRHYRIGPIDLLSAERFDTACAAPASLRTVAETGFVHPLLLSSVVSWSAGPEETELDPDGLHADVRRGLDPQLRLMGAGQELDLRAPVRIGEEIAVTATLIDVELKQGRSGEMLLGTEQRTFAGEVTGEVLLVSTEKWIAR